jgi:hypothetical protein
LSLAAKIKESAEEKQNQNYKKREEKTTRIIFNFFLIFLRK